MDADALKTVDALYLKIFQQNLRQEMLKDQILLSQHRWQSEELAKAQELAPELRQHYKEIFVRLNPLIVMLGEVIEDLRAGPLSWQQVLQTDAGHNEIIPPDKAQVATDRLDTSESDILNVLKDVGRLLADLPSAIVSWHDSAFFSVQVELKRLPERPCYDLEFPIAFRSTSLLMADYFAKRHHGIKRGQWPHDLIDEIMPADMLTLIEDLWIEMEVCGDGYASWRTRKKDDR